MPFEKGQSGNEFIGADLSRKNIAFVEKFYYSTYGKYLAWGLARKYREDMVNLVEQERIRLDKMVENGYAISEGR